ncbi:MAG: hypothetical protein V4529_16445 [Gemmatimonadota bacterium]
MTAIKDVRTFLLGMTQAVGATPSSTQAAVLSQLLTLRIPCLKPGAGAAIGTGDDAAAGTDITDNVLWSNDTGFDVTLTGVSFRPGVTGFTESTSVFSTMTLTKRTSAGATSTSVATATTNTVANGGLGTMTVGQTGAFTLTATIADRTIAAGACILYSKTHASTGTILPGGVITLTFRLGDA